MIVVVVNDCIYVTLCMDLQHFKIYIFINIYIFMKQTRNSSPNQRPYSVIHQLPKSPGAMQLKNQS